MDLFKRIQDLSAIYDDDGPSATVQGSRPMFNNGGMLVQPSNDGSRPGYSGREYSTVEFDKFSDDVLKAYAEDDITKIMKPKYKTNINRVKINKFNNLDKLIKKTGLDEETIFDLFDDREAFQDLELNEDVWKRGRRIDPNKAKFYKQAENWIVKNSKRYADPDKFKKAFIRTFGKNNDIIQKINRPDKRMLMRVPFSDWFRTNIMGSSDDSMRNQVKPNYNSNQLDNIFKTAIYTNNENVRNKIINELTNILPEKGSKRTPDIREKFKNSPILKKFNLNQRIDGPIARLLAKEVGEDLLKQISSFRKPFLGTTELINYLKDRVNPKYKSMFEEAVKATAFAQKNSWPKARQALNSSNSIMFDHKIPKALIEAGYADEIEYIKLNPTSAEFNANIKRAEFDQPMIKLINEFERAKNLDGKAKVVEKMNTLKNNFSKKYGGYLDEVSITADKTGKPVFKSSASPVTKKTDLVSSLGKSMVQAGEINQKKFSALLKAVGCPNGVLKASTGANCLIKGRELINSGMKNASPAQAKNFTKVLKEAGTAGRNLIKFGVIPEALFVGADSLVRLGLGDTFQEAGLRASDYLLPGDQTRTAEISKVERTLGPEAAKIVGRTIDYKNQLSKIDSLKQQKQNLENLSGGGQFDYIPDLSSDVKNMDTQILKAESDLQNKFMVPEAEKLYAERAQEEAYDISKSKSPFTKIKKFASGLEQQKDDPFLSDVMVPEKTQMQLNLNMLPNFRDAMQSEDVKKQKIIMNLPDEFLNSSVGPDAVQYKKDLQDAFKLENLKDQFGAEQIYGTQGNFAGQPLAGGGIAKMAGDRSGAMTKSMNPDSQGLSYLMNRVKKVQE